MKKINKTLSEEVMEEKLGSPTKRMVVGSGIHKNPEEVFIWQL